MTSKKLPYFLAGEVVKGFGRGSKELGCPTANYPVEVVNSLPEDLETGVYYGFAQVNKSDVHKMVMSIGWNPFYKNKQKSIETHIMHKFDSDFYGKEMKIAILGYLRPERNFNSVDELIVAINNDIKQAEERLDEPENIKYKSDAFFSN